MPRLIRILWIVGAAVMAILLFLLASASENTAFFDKHYVWLMIVNVIVAVVMFCIVAWMLYRLYNRYRRGRYGSKLTARFVILFALMGIIPGVIIYVVSLQFVSRSIESWFDVKVEAALDSGVKLAQSILDETKHELIVDGQKLATELLVAPESRRRDLIAAFERTNKNTEAAVYSKTGRVLTTSGATLPAPPESSIEQASPGNPYAEIEGETDDTATAKQEASLSVRVIIAIPYGERVAYLQIMRQLPDSIVTNAEALRSAYGEYQIRSLSRSGLKKIYITTLSLTLLLAIFAAIAASFQIAINTVRPLLLLEQGTRAVAEGNLSPRPTVTGYDELGTLTQLFSDMTTQLAESRANEEKSRTELENAKIFLESVLTNMSSGVIVLSADFAIIGSNEPARQMLRTDLEQFTGTKITDLPETGSFGPTVTDAFYGALTAASGDAREAAPWQKQIEFQPGEFAALPDGATLLVRGTTHRIGGENRHIIVFDDITAVLSAQRASAWREIARRLAHEIKNPLTPIQLSAERLVMKLSGKLDEKDAAMLTKSADMIVMQVDAMKKMVNDFRDFAKIPVAEPVPLDLNALITDIVHFYGGADSPITYRCDEDVPMILGDSTQLRQVLHNLIQNAQDATGDNPADRPPAIAVSLENIRYPDSPDVTRAVRLTIDDNGPGFDSSIIQKIFEPYVTTKKTGTGLGLPMVKKIIENHGAQIEIGNRTDTTGAHVSVLFLELVPPET